VRNNDEIGKLAAAAERLILNGRGPRARFA
jgi:hypothetical protein